MRPLLRKKRKPFIQVELGSGQIPPGQKRRSNKTSIDIRVKSRSRTHKQSDFIGGLLRLKNNSVDLIPANASLGYYTQNARQIGILRKTPLIPSSPEGRELISYTTRVLKTAHQKLKRNGQVVVKIDEDFIEPFIHAVQQSPFTNVSIQELGKEHLHTPWLKIIGAEKKVFQVALVKA